MSESFTTWTVAYKLPRIVRNAANRSTRSTCSDCCCHPRSDLECSFVLPSPDDQPSGLLEETVSLVITCPVLSNFVTPELGVLPVHALSMLCAPMPEASVDVHGHSGLTEDEISSPSHAFQGLGVDAVPETRGMENATDSKLRCGVAGRLELHLAPDAGR